MSRNLLLFSPDSTKAGPAGLEAIHARGRGRPRVGALIDYFVAVPTPKKPVDITVGPPHKKGRASVKKTYPLSLIRKVIRNKHGSGSAVDLQLLRAMRWPA
jgi:hypothetical protein